MGAEKVLVMDTFVLPFIAFVAGLLLLIKGADLFVRGGSGLAARVQISKTLIGFTIISFGTTLPEFVVNINALLMRSPDISLGNVLGSCVANIALILSLCAILSPESLKIRGSVPWSSEWGFMFGAMILFCFLALRGVIDVYAGVVLLSGFFLTLWLLWKRRRHVEHHFRESGWRDYLSTVVGLAGVIAGSYLIVQSAVFIATASGISEFVIGLSLVAVGTSLPELFTALVAVLRGEGELSVGNLLGANVYNLLFVMGIGGLILPIPIVSFFDIAVMIGFAILVLPIFLWDRVPARLWASLILTLYGFYIGHLFGFLR